MITFKDIEERLKVTNKQVEMAVYSGALPSPNENNEWDPEHVEFFIQTWANRIARAKPKDHGSNYMSNGLTFPSHQR